MARRSTDENQALANGLEWVETWHQKGGYGGPVVHYWNNSFHYTGPRQDWRVEGLMATFLALDRPPQKGLSARSEWLNKAYALGKHAVDAQRKDGSFIISEFEETPGFWHSAQPHECAVDIGLLLLGERLQNRQDADATIFIHAAERNLKKILIGKFWNEKEQTFQQYQRGQFDEAPNLFVPNKIATACEALVRAYQLTHQKEYLEYAEKAAKKILELQSSAKETRGGIFQSNRGERIITIYTARCVRPLLLLGKVTGKHAYTRAAKQAAKFMAAQQNKHGGFDFGTTETGEKITFPRFVAGSGEILSALHQAGGFASAYARGMKWLLTHQHSNGGFSSFEGLTQKNTFDKTLSGASWMDELAVVGWNDKALRLLAENFSGKLPVSTNTRTWKTDCGDETLEEGEKIVHVRGTTPYTFRKHALFSDSPLNPIKHALLSLAKHSHQVPRTIGSTGFRFTVRR